MRIKSTDYRVSPGSEVDLKKRPTAVRPSYRTKREYRDILSAHVKELGAQQELLYASDRYALLIIFQGMDAAGKDGAIAHVMSGINPQGCRVVSFKQPSAEELKHDFLWRTDPRAAGTRPNRHFQSILLRGGLDRPRAS